MLYSTDIALHIANCLGDKFGVRLLNCQQSFAKHQVRKRFCFSDWADAKIFKDCHEKCKLVSIAVNFDPTREDDDLVFEEFCSIWRNYFKNVKFNISLDMDKMTRFLKLASESDANIEQLYISSVASDSKLHVSTIMWPSSLLSLRLDCCAGEGVEDLKLPARLQVLAFCHLLFDQPIERLVLPNGLRIIELGEMFSQPIEELRLPDSLEAIRLGSSFNMPIEKLTLPAGLTELRFGTYFNQPIKLLDFSRTKLLTLEFGQRFDQPIEQLNLPMTVRQIRLALSYRHPFAALQLNNRSLVVHRIREYFV
jgi:hypothetical protein